MDTRMRARRQRFVFSLAVVALLIGGLPKMARAAVEAQTGQPTASVSNFQSGLVTSAKSGTTLQINNTNFTLKPQVIIKDDEGRLRDERELLPGVQVQYHLKEGQIDQIMIVLPK
ncbi:MAG TPA: hypothetical protein VNK46_09590 [Nitrospiraceae bacterium]|jgi:hypothetical protein|nr:hypothetical protein [Nitrospiraceae bacterium]